MVEKKKANHIVDIPRRERKNRGFYMRMTDSELNELDFLSYESEESKTEIMRKAFKMYREWKKNAL